MHSFSKLSTVIYFLQIILYRIKTKVSYFTLFSAFGFAIVCSRYNDEDTRIYLQLVASPNCFACEFTVHLQRYESEIYNYQRIQLSNNKFVNGILEAEPPAHYSDLFPPNNIVQYKNQGVIFCVIQCIQLRDSLQSVQ